MHEVAMSKLHAALNTPPDRWTHAQLAELRAVELEVLCRLLGVPYSGTKPQRIARLLDLADLRTTLASYERPGQMTPFFRRASLLAMAKRAHIYLGGNKYGLAAGLLNWRNECRQRGQQYHAELQAARARQPRQLRLPFNDC
jgi:hypothetical protein